jgi:dimethylglycine dehydrogenase
VIRQGWKVTGLEPASDGGWIVSGPPGRIKTEIIVNAAGFYADEVAKLTGARLPVVNMRHHYLLTEPIPEIESLREEPPVFRDVDAGVYGRREGGGLLFGIYEKDCRDFGADGMPESFVSTLFDPDFERIAPELEHVFEAIPFIAETGIRSTVHGPFVFTPDGRPLIGWMPGQRNHFTAAGFLAGISMSGGFGQLMAEWIVDGAPHRDLAACDVLRFGDWAIGDFARARAHETYATRYKMHFPNEEIRAGRPVRTTQMHERYAAMGANFGFADGWERPNWFAGSGNAPEETPTFRRSEAHAAVARECAAVHDAAGYTELLSFANYLVEGPDAKTFLRRILPGRLPAKGGALALSPIVNAKGGLLGDATILRLDEQAFMLVASGAFSRIHLREWLPHTHGLDVTFTNRTDTWAGFMVAGPWAREIVTRLLGEAPPAFFRGSPRVVAGVPAVVLRLSYVGELAYEVHCAMANQPALHDALLAAADATGCPLEPFGARAMNAMRIEKGLPRTGDELTIEATPFETGMGTLLDLDRTTLFPGQQTLRALAGQPLRYRMVSLRLDDTDIDPSGAEPVTSDGVLAGYISSAAYGHRVGAPVALAFLRPHLCQNGTRVAVHILGREVQAIVSLQPLFDPEGRRARS